MEALSGRVVARLLADRAGGTGFSGCSTIVATHMPPRTAHMGCRNLVGSPVWRNGAPIRLAAWGEFPTPGNLLLAASTISLATEHSL